MQLNTSYYYQSLPICVIDAVFSIGVNYTSVLNVVQRFCKHSNVQRYREYGSHFPNIADQYTVSAFNGSYGELPPELLAGKEILENMQRTSTRNGILKAEAVQGWMKVLEKHKINTFQDLQMRFENLLDEDADNVSPSGLNDLEKDILAIPGQKSGISLSYFNMLAGRDNLVKPDRMIMRFLHQRFNDPSIQTSGAVGIINDLVAELIDRYGYTALTVRELDHAVWNYQRAQPE